MREQIITQLLLFFITVISTLVSAYIIPLIKSKINSQELERLTYYIGIAVRAAEQIFTAEQWKQKKQYVLRYTMDLINDNFRLNFTEAQVDALIEGIVNEVKKG